MTHPHRQTEKHINHLCYKFCRAKIGTE